MQTNYCHATEDTMSMTHEWNGASYSWLLSVYKVTVYKQNRF